MTLDSININYIVYFLLNIQLKVNSHQNVAICYIGKNQNGSYPGSCSRQVPNMFKLTKIWSPITNGMPTYTYIPSLRLLAQSLDIWPTHSTRAGALMESFVWLGVDKDIKVLKFYKNEQNSDFNFTVISWFLGNVRVKPYFNTQCPLPPFPRRFSDPPSALLVKTTTANTSHQTL